MTNKTHTANTTKLEVAGPRAGLLREQTVCYKRLSRVQLAADGESPTCKRCINSLAKSAVKDAAEAIS